MLHILFLALGLMASAADYSWEVVPTVPTCAAGISCTKEEMLDHVQKSGIVPRLQEMTERAFKDGGKISLAFMSFTEESLWKTLCDAGKRGVAIDGFFHSKAGAAPNGLAFRLERDCQSETKKKNVKMHYMGMPETGKSGWRLHHNKFFLVDYGARKVELAFGSANLSTQGLTVNFENWNFFTAPKSVPFVQGHLCAVKAMKEARKASQKEDDPKVFRDSLDKCLVDGPPTSEQSERVLKRDGVIAFFAPDKKDRTYQILADNINRVVSGGRIRMAVYFFMHKPLIEALSAASKRGVEVELLVDDDIFLGKSIPAQKRFWDTMLQPSVSGFKVRVFDTNEGIFQLQHNKYLVLEGVDRLGANRVFGGAGQFTLSAFQNNYENFFLTEDPKVVRAYQDLYTQLWKLGSDL